MLTQTELWFKQFAMIIDKDNTDPGFSWSACEGCNSELGGLRYEMLAANPGDEEETELGAVCTDCMNRLLTGEIPA